MDQESLATRVHYSKAWLSNVETGQVAPHAEQIVALEKALNLPPGALMNIREQFDAESLPRGCRPWTDEERRAAIMRTFQLALIPELLQTESYARALFPGDEASVQTLMVRQAILTREAPEPPRLYCVLDEAVLHQARGGKEVMREQLEVLIAAVSPPRLTVQVVPSGRSPRSLGAFTIATVDGAEVGYVETVIRGIVTGNRDDIADLLAAWEAVRTFALSQQESIDLIQQVLAERWT
jgi:transcriptional regulator with XRE-family HTH domain